MRGALSPLSHKLSCLGGYQNIPLLSLWAVRPVQSLSACTRVHFTLPYVTVRSTYEGHLESKERFAIKKYLLIIGKKKNMQVLSHTFAYFST